MRGYLGNQGRNRPKGPRHGGGGGGGGRAIATVTVTATAPMAMVAAVPMT